MATPKLGAALLCSLLLCELCLASPHDFLQRLRRDSYNRNNNNNRNYRRHHHRDNHHHSRDNFNHQQDNVEPPGAYDNHEDGHHNTEEDFRHNSRNQNQRGYDRQHNRNRFDGPPNNFARPGPPEVIGHETEFRENPNNNFNSFHENDRDYFGTSPSPSFSHHNNGRTKLKSYSTKSSKHESHRMHYDSNGLVDKHHYSPSFTSYESQDSSKYLPAPYQPVEQHSKSYNVIFQKPQGYNRGHYHSSEKSGIVVSSQGTSGPYYQPGSTLQRVPGTSSHTFNTCGSASQYQGFCKSKAAGHYAHPGSLECFIQCDAWGSGYVRPCAPGTYWAHQGSGPAGFNACVSKKHGFQGNTVTQAPKNNFAHHYTAITRYTEHDPYGHGHGQGYYK